MTPKLRKAINFRSIFTRSSAGGSVDEPRLLATSGRRPTSTDASPWTKSDTIKNLNGEYPSHQEEFLIFDEDVTAMPEGRFRKLYGIPAAKFVTPRHELERADRGLGK